MGKSRRYFTSEQKAAIVRERLIDKVTVSDLCDRHDIQPTIFYRWQKASFENLPSLLVRKSDLRLGDLGRCDGALEDNPPCPRLTDRPRLPFQ